MIELWEQEPKQEPYEETPTDFVIWCEKNDIDPEQDPYAYEAYKDELEFRKGAYWI